MHVCLYSPALPEDGGPNGIVTYVRYLENALCRIGHQVSVITGDRVRLFDGRVLAAQERTISRYLLDRLRHRPWSDFRADSLNKMVEIVQDALPIDVFEVEESFGFSSDIRVSCPIIVRLHGPWVFGCELDERKRDSYTKRVRSEGAALAKADAITSPSQRLLNDTLSYYRLQPSFAAVISNPMPRSELRWSYDGCDPYQVLCVGRFDLRKGADVTLAAFSQVANVCPEARLVFAGPDTGIASPSGRRWHFAEYSNTMLNEKTRKRVDYVGNVGESRLNELRLGSAFCLVNSRFETFSYSAAEALSIGAPLVVSDGYGIPEMLVGSSEALVPIGNADHLATRWLQLLKNRNYLERMSEAGTAIQDLQLDPLFVAQQTADFYHRVCRERLT